MNSERSEVRSQKSELPSESSVELRIEELVLHGFAPSDRYVICDAVERELARLLGERGIPISLRSKNATDEITGATFNVAHDAKPRPIGHQIAKAVYQRFSQ